MLKACHETTVALFSFVGRWLQNDNGPRKISGVREEERCFRKITDTGVKFTETWHTAVELAPKYIPVLVHI